MGIEVRTRARGLGQVSVARQCVGRDAKVLGGPCERESGSVNLGLGYHLLIEVSFAEDKEMPCRVVVRCGVARDRGAAQFVDVAIAVDADVIRDVDPPMLVLVVPLVLAEVTWGIAVVTEEHGLVMEGHPGDGVAFPSGAGRSRTPSISA
jgi:hypothetical protein